MKDNKFFVAGLALAVVVILGSLVLAGSLMSKALNQSNEVAKLGVNLTYSASQSNLELYNYLDAITADVKAARLPFADINYGSATFSPGALSGATLSTSTDVTLSGGTAPARPGDLVLVSVASSSANSSRWIANGWVSGNGTATVVLSLSAASTTGANFGNGVLVQAWSFSSSSLRMPAALTAATTTAGNR